MQSEYTDQTGHIRGFALMLKRVGSLQNFLIYKLTNLYMFSETGGYRGVHFILFF